MATLTERADIAVRPDFIRRVRQAIIQAAADIGSEDAGTANHTSRVELAKVVTTYPTEWAKNFAFGVANNSNVGTGSSDPADDSADGDGALQFVINSLWDTYAGT
jgi:hypothetical protein